MKVRIDSGRCAGCGVCANICPSGIEMVNGKAAVKNENADCLRDAANACPGNAITLGDEQGLNNQGGITPGVGRGRRMAAGRRGGSGRGMGKGRGRGRSTRR